MVKDITYDKYFKEIKKYLPLTFEEEKELFIKMQNGDEDAKDLLIKSNQRFIIHKAFEQIGYIRNCPRLDIMDLIIEGNIALMDSLRSFDLSHNKRISSYASKKITWEIKKLIYNNIHTVNIHEEAQRHVKKMNSFIESFYNEYGRNPTYYEISMYLDINIDLVYKLFVYDSYMSNSHIDIEFMDEKVNSSYYEYSSIEEEAIPLVDNDYLVNHLKETLNTKDQDILFRRFTLDGKSFASTIEIAKSYGVSYQNISVIQKRILRNLKKDKYIRKVNDYYCIKNTYRNGKKL